MAQAPNPPLEILQGSPIPQESPVPQERLVEDIPQNPRGEDVREALDAAAEAVTEAATEAVAGAEALTQRTANTLEPDPEDELLPSEAVEGDLSDAQLQEIRLNAVRLDKEAEAAYGEGDRLRAYSTWFRALRLLQYGDSDEEIVALGRIGARAWQDGLPAESQAIAQRLLTLDEAAAPQTKTIDASREGLEKTLQTQSNLALAHEQVGALDPAVERYEWLLERNQELKRSQNEAQLVAKLATLNLARLDYPKASRYTQMQLEQLRRQPNRSVQAETQLVAQLAYAYEQNGAWEEAIAQQQILLTRSAATPESMAQRPALLLAVGRNQERAGLGQAATQTYQESYRTAQEQQKFELSHQALMSLATLYEQRSQVEDALTVYNVLRRVDELSYNVFGLLNTYESMGELQAEQGDRDGALRSLKQALHAAQQLDYRVAEIQVKLNNLLNDE